MYARGACFLLLFISLVLREEEKRHKAGGREEGIEHRADKTFKGGLGSKVGK
jgi:hypothetical protein